LSDFIWYFFFQTQVNAKQKAMSQEVLLL